MNGGEITAKVLKEENVPFVFTLCGGHISPILAASRKLGIRIVDTRHEATAAFAADAVSRISNNVGVAAVTAGPGITNTITAVHNARMAQSPMVLLGGAAPTLLKGRGALQDIDQTTLMKPHVKWMANVRRRSEIYPALKEAFVQAKSGVPGPVFVELPLDVLYDETLIRSQYLRAGGGNNWKARLTQWYIQRHLNRLFDGEPVFSTRSKSLAIPTHSAGDIHRVANALRGARRPLMLLGSGAMMQPGLAEKLAIAVTGLNCPLYLSGMSRGLLGKNHPLQLRHHRKDALREADVVLLAGVPNDFRLEYGRHISQRATLISVNRSKTDLTKNRTPQIGICADPMNFLIEMGGQLQLPANPEWINTLHARDQKRELQIEESSREQGNGINPVALFKAWEKELPQNAILVADGGDFVGTASYILSPRKPLSWLDPGAFGTLGMGAGFALAAKLCNPDSPVYIIYGDGSCAYGLMEFDTYVRHGIPVTAIVGNDGGWTQIARDQIEILHDDVATVLAQSDYHKVAQALGGEGWRTDNLTAFQEALRQSMKSVKPSLINAILSKSDFRKGSISV